MDELEKVRAARGEGWDWTRIQREPCPQCGGNPAATEPPALGEHAVDLARRWRAFLLEADDTYLRTNPEFGINSPIQYGAHVRDVLRVATQRMQLGLAEDGPTVPIFNPPQEVWEEYNRLDVDALAGDLEDRAGEFAAVIAGIDGDDRWERTVVNDRGPYGVYTFTIAGLARNAVHEAHHHLLDATGTLPVSG
jgi:hypothetical protein